MNLYVTDDKNIMTRLAKILKVPYNNANVYGNYNSTIVYLPNDFFSIKLNNVGVKLFDITDKYEDFFFTFQPKNYDIIKKIKYSLKYKKFDNIINCCCSNARGQLNFDLFKKYLKDYFLDTKVKRIWLTENSEESLMKQLNNLEDNSSYEPLGNSLLAEIIIDEYWYYILQSKFNINDMKVNYKELFLLKLVEDKEKDIDKHNSDNYYKISYELDGFKGYWFNKSKQDKLYSQEEVEAVIKTIKDSDIFIMSIDNNINEKEHPLLYNLNDLLHEISKIADISNERAMQALNTLYVEGYITNPNTSSRHLPSVYADNLTTIVKSLKELPQYKKYVDYIKTIENITVTSRAINDKYIDDTHAIIPTSKPLSSINLDTIEYFIYDLIVKRFLTIFMGNLKVRNIKIIGSLGVDNFVKFEKEIELEKGWTIIYDDIDIYEYIKMPKRNNDINIKFYPGQKIRPSEYKFNIQNNTTRTPNRYKVSSLIKLMESSGKIIRNDAKKIQTRHIGISNPEERMNIIQGAIDKNIINLVEKNVTLGENGKKLMTIIPDNIFSLKLFTLINKQIAEVLKGQSTVKDTVEELIKYINNTLYSTPSTNENLNINYSNIINTQVCYICKSKLIEKKDFIGCTNYPNCKLSIPKEKSGYVLKENDIIQLLTNGKTDNIIGFNFRNTPIGQGKAQLILNSEGKVQFFFDKDKKNTALE